MKKLPSEELDNFNELEVKRVKAKNKTRVTPVAVISVPRGSRFYSSDELIKGSLQHRIDHTLSARPVKKIDPTDRRPEKMSEIEILRFKASKALRRYKGKSEFIYQMRGLKKRRKIFSEAQCRAIIKKVKESEELYAHLLNSPPLRKWGKK